MTDQIPNGDSNRTVHIDCDAYNLFPVTWSAGSFKEKAEYYGVGNVSMSGGVWGAMKKYCGIDDVCTTQTYDAFGRPTTRTDNVSSAETTWTYRRPGDNGVKAYVVTEWSEPRCNGNLTRTHYNGFGQVIAVQTANQNWHIPLDECKASATGTEIHVNYRYGALGQVIEESVPRTVGRNSWTSVTAAFTTGSSKTAYDALGRPIQNTAPNGQVTVTKYAGRKTAVWQVARGDSANPPATPDRTDRVIRWTETDALGNLAMVQTFSKPSDQGGAVEAWHLALG